MGVTRTASVAIIDALGGLFIDIQRANACAHITHASHTFIHVSLNCHAWNFKFEISTQFSYSVLHGKITLITLHKKGNHISILITYSLNRLKSYNRLQHKTPRIEINDTLNSAPSRKLVLKTCQWGVGVSLFKIGGRWILSVTPGGSGLGVSCAHTTHEG